MTDYQYEFLGLFRDEANERLDNMINALLSIERGDQLTESINNLFREAHTIKGAAGMLGLTNVHDLAHILEDVLHEARTVGEFPPRFTDPILRSIDTLRVQIAGDPTPAPELIAEIERLKDAEEIEEVVPVVAPTLQASPSTRRSLHVPAEKIDRLLDLVGETTLHRSRLEYVLSAHLDKQTDVTDELDIGNNLLSELKEAAIGMRTLPFISIVGSFPRAVRDLARAEGKEVELELIGTETELDRTILESLPETLTHILRNSLAHGIESAEERMRQNKPPRGTITIAAYQRGSEVEITVKDDGRGVSAALVEEARKVGSLAEVLSQSGYSTSSSVTQLSGRGVGLDAVRTTVESFGGRFDVRSEPGAGMTVILTLPLALALLEVMLIERGGNPYGIPLSAIEEVQALNGEVFVEGQTALQIRDESVRVVDLATSIGTTASALSSDAPVVIVASGDRRVAIACDVLVGQEEIVVKSLGLLSGVRGYLGGAILGDGRIALLIDPTSLLSRPSKKNRVLAADPTKLAVDDGKILVVEDFYTARELQRSILEAAGYRVATAENGKDALRQLQDDADIKLVITDIEMPFMDGFRLTQSIRENETTSKIPVIIVTTRESAEDRQKGLDVGADAYMTKRGFNQQSLLETVERLVGT